MQYTLKKLEDSVMIIQAEHADGSLTEHGYQLTDKEAQAVLEDKSALKGIYLDQVAMIDEAFDGQKENCCEKVTLEQEDIETITITKAEIDAKKEENFNEE